MGMIRFRQGMEDTGRTRWMIVGHLKYQSQHYLAKPVVCAWWVTAPRSVSQPNCDGFTVDFR